MEENLRKIQLTELEILVEIDRVCKKNNIDYWIAYGTMLGAVRHKGFIPWDDDIDIYMKFEDVKRFRNCCKRDLNEQFFLQDKYSEQMMNFLFCKVRKNGTRMAQKEQEEIIGDYHLGIWVDIFLLVNYSNSEKKQEEQVKLLHKLQRLRTLQPYIKQGNLLKRIAKFAISKWLMMREGFLWYRVNRLGGKDAKKYIVVDVNYFGDNIKKVKGYSKEYFKGYREYEFENHYFSGMPDYDGYLKCCFGEDYMIPKKYTQHEVDYSKVIFN